MIHGFVVKTIVVYVLVWSPIIRLGVRPNINLIFYQWHNSTFLLLIWNLIKLILIGVNPVKNPWTVTNWMTTIILTLCGFWFSSMYLNYRYSNELLHRVNVLNDETVETNELIRNCCFLSGKVHVHFIIGGFTKPCVSYFWGLTGFQACVV